MEVIDITHLPKYMQKRPEIRALTLRVYPDGPRSYKVPGTSKIYDVSVINNSYHCTCQAASGGVTCAHIHAVRRYVTESLNA